MKKVVIVLGPTAVGKTKIGIELAKRLNTEIISGDSVQVYKGLDIGSAKATVEEMDGIKHHLIDILEPNMDYSVCDFQKHARELIEKLDVPVIVGGTGLYIKAAISNYEFDAPKRDYSFEEEYANEFFESTSITCPILTLPFSSFSLTSYIDFQLPKSFQSLFN